MKTVFVGINYIQKFLQAFTVSFMFSACLVSTVSFKHPSFPCINISDIPPPSKDLNKRCE